MKFSEMNSAPLPILRVTSRQGFTLIELLVVISILATLAAILMPALTTANRMASRTVCGSQMRQLGIALQGYLGDYEDRYPSVGWSTAYSGWGARRGTGRWQNVLEPYTGTYVVFNCPTVRKKWPHFSVRNADEGWVVRGDAPGGTVCLTAYNSQTWGRYPSVPTDQTWAPSNPGPMTESSASALITQAVPGGISARCPVFFDGFWQNDGANQPYNQWGAYFPHAGQSNFVFNDGHVETHDAGDVISWTPLLFR